MTPTTWLLFAYPKRYRPNYKKRNPGACTLISHFNKSITSKHYRAVSASNSQDPTPNTQYPTSNSQDPLLTTQPPTPTWLALGDSYTIGEGVKPEVRWPAQLAHHQHLSPPHYVAKTGWTTLHLLEAIAHTDFAGQYDWVSVQIGVNDQYDGIGTDAYREGLSNIIDFAVHKVARPQCVIVLSIPDYSVTPFAQNKGTRNEELTRIAQEVALFNTIAREIAAANQATYCDITPLSQQAANDPALLAEDGLHPSGKMYRMWVEKIVREVAF